MSSAGQIVGGVVGAVIGFYVGGPVGAFQGAALGAGIGGVLDPPKGPTVEGPRLQDKGVQTSTYGTAMPRVYGTIGGAGNITQLENNKLKETVRKQKQGGKGGGSTTTTKLYTYSATFQLSLCEGPIAGVRRIWCSDKLIYNAGSDDLETIIASNQAAEGFRIYLGTDDQMPDPRYEAEYGVGNVSAHRGEAYIAFYDFQLADFSNTLQAAQFKVEIINVSDTFELPIFAEIASDPGEQVYISGRPGPYGNSFIFAGVLFGTTTAWRMTQNGILSQINGPVGGLSPWRAESFAVQSLDINDNLYTHTSDGTERLLFLSGDSWSEKTTPYDLLNFRYYERNGNMWFIWTDDNNNPGTNPSGSWLAKVYDLGAIHGIQYTTRIDGGALGGSSYVPMTDGNILSYECDLDPGVSGPLSLSYRDELGTTIKSFSVTINARAGQLNEDSSRGYHSDTGILHIVFMLYSLPNPMPSEYGKFYYVQIDLENELVIKQVEVFFPEFAALNVHIEPDMMIEEDGIIYIGSVDGQKILYAAFAHTVLTESGVPLSTVINAEVNQSSLISSSDINAVLLSNTVRGYRINGGSLRSSLEPLQAAFPFDVRQHGYQIQFLPRGQSSIVTIPWEDLGATEGDKATDIIQQSREMDSQLPARTTVKYLDAAREYAIAEQYSERLNTEAINRVDRQLPLVLTANEAAGVSEVLNFLPWLERNDAAFTLPPTYRYLESGDIVSVETQDATYELRLTEINEMPSGLLQVKAKPNRAALYTSSATGSEGVPPSGTIGLGGPSLFVPLDIPVVDETIQDDVGFVGIMTGVTAGWPGALAVRSNDGAQTWTDLQGYSGKATIGAARGILSSSTGTMIDQSSIIVDLVSGTLESITKDQMLSGINYAAYGLDGRWEIIRFQNAALQSDGSYLVSHFVRGDRGTEWSTGLHVAGDYFVLLDDPDNAFIGSPVESIALERLYRGVTSGASIDSASDVSFTYQGVNLECLSPVYAIGTRDGSSNFTGTFTRRSRLSSSWWTTGTEAPVGETTQAYEIDVMNGSVVERTISAVLPTFTYSAADQTTDFGSPQASITFRIYQLSGTVGRGYPYEVTL